MTSFDCESFEEDLSGNVSTGLIIDTINNDPVWSLAEKRQMELQHLLEVLKTIEDDEEEERILQAVLQFADDPEVSMLKMILTQLTDPSIMCGRKRRRSSQDFFSAYVTPVFLKCFSHPNDEFREMCHGKLAILIQINYLTAVELEKVLEMLVDLAQPDKTSNQKNDSVSFLSALPEYTDHTDSMSLKDSKILPMFLTMCADPDVAIRKACALNFARVCGSVNQRYLEYHLLPKFSTLCEDSVWGVRKACTESFVDVSKRCAVETRKNLLTQLLVALLRDISRWVRAAAYQALGGFISTFAEKQEDVDDNDDDDDDISSLDSSLRDDGGPYGRSEEKNIITDVPVHLSLTVCQEESVLAVPEKPVVDWPMPNANDDHDTLPPATTYNDDLTEEMNADSASDMKIENASGKNDDFRPTEDANDVVSEMEARSSLKEAELDLGNVTGKLAFHFLVANSDEDDSATAVVTDTSNNDSMSSIRDNNTTSSDAVENQSFQNIPGEERIMRCINADDGSTSCKEVSDTAFQTDNLSVEDLTIKDVSDDNSMSADGLDFVAMQELDLELDSLERGIVVDEESSSVEIHSTGNQKVLERLTGCRRIRKCLTENQEIDESSGNQRTRELLTGRQRTEESSVASNSVQSHSISKAAAEETKPKLRSRSEDESSVLKSVEVSRNIAPKKRRAVTTDEENTYEDDDDPLRTNIISEEGTDGLDSLETTVAARCRKNVATVASEGVERKQRRPCFHTASLSVLSDPSDEMASNIGSVKVHVTDELNVVDGVVKPVESLVKINITHQPILTLPDGSVSDINDIPKTTEDFFQRAKVMHIPDDTTLTPMRRPMLKKGQGSSSRFVYERLLLKATTENRQQETTNELSELQKTNRHLATIQSIVPSELLEHYLDMAEPSRVQMVDVDILKHCAYNLPAVAFTLGRHNWACLRPLYQFLAGNMQCQVRRLVALSIHKMAAILGDDILCSDLLPIFNDFLRDADEVRSGMMKNLARFLQLLNPSIRESYLPKLDELLAADNPTKWRYRHEFCQQLTSLVRLFSPSLVHQFVLPLAFRLSMDRVYDVRQSAAILLCVIAGMMSEKSEDLLTSLAEDLRERFVQNSSWRQRQLFIHFCQRVLEMRSLSTGQFVDLFLSSILSLHSDSVPNVRISLARFLNKNMFKFSDVFECHDEIQPREKELLDALKSLGNDRDPDVRHPTSLLISKISSAC